MRRRGRACPSKITGQTGARGLTSAGVVRVAAPDMADPRWWHPALRWVAPAYWLKVVVARGGEAGRGGALSTPALFVERPCPLRKAASRPSLSAVAVPTVPAPSAAGRADAALATGSPNDIPAGARRRRRWLVMPSSSDSTLTAEPLPVQPRAGPLPSSLRVVVHGLVLRCPAAVPLNPDCPSRPIRKELPSAARHGPSRTKSSPWHRGVPDFRLDTPPPHLTLSSTLPSHVSRPRVAPRSQESATSPSVHNTHLSPFPVRSAPPCHMLLRLRPAPTTLTRPLNAFRSSTPHSARRFHAPLTTMATLGVEKKHKVTVIGSGNW
jgi:hypothetical protein